MYNYQNVTCRQFDDSFDRDAMELVDTINKYLVAAANARDLLVSARQSQVTGMLSRLLLPFQDCGYTAVRLFSCHVQ